MTLQKYFHLKNIIIVDDEVDLEWLHPVLLGVSPVDHVPGARAPGALATRLMADDDARARNGGSKRFHNHGLKS